MSTCGYADSMHRNGRHGANGRLWVIGPKQMDSNRVALPSSLKDDLYREGRIHSKLELVEHIPRALQHAMTIIWAICKGVHNNAVKIKTNTNMDTKMEIKLKSR